MRESQDDALAGLHPSQYRLPLRGPHDGKDSDASNELATLPRPINGGRSKRFPEHLHLSQGAFRRLRSPTESSMSTLSSISSTHVPDSATTCSLSTLASPISTSYASEVIEQFAKHTIDPARASRIVHRYKDSNATCSTYVNDEEEALYFHRKKEIDLDVASIRSTDKAARCAELESQSSPLSEATVEELPLEDERRGNRLTVIHRPRSSDGWETTSTASDDHTHDDADAVLDYTLQLVYGIDSNESPIPRSRLQRLTHDFLAGIGQAMREECEDTDQAQHRSSTGFSSSTISEGNVGDDNQKGEKRKKLDQSDKGADDVSDNEGYNPMPSKRIKPTPSDDNLRLSCPYRKRNPHRFNVRDHHSCAMTYFPKFAELRQHIVKQHKRDDPSAFVCDRCNTDFPSRKGLRDHQRLPKEEMCDISEHNPESGIDGPTSNKLLSRKRASGASPYVQWREIWNILFPDDDDSSIQPYDFTPVIEHFEISDNFERSFKFLQGSLRDMMENPATLETLAAKFHQCFIETVGQCILNAQNMPYTNRSNKRAEPSRFRSSVAAAKRGSSRPDSGIIIDDGSEESGSIVNTALRHDSVRTVRNAQRDSSRTVGPRELLPSSQALFTGLDETLLAQLSKNDGDNNAMAYSGTAAMDPVSVQAWNNAVLSQQMTPHSMETPQAGPYSTMADMNMQSDMIYTEDTFYQMFGAMPAGFPGFIGQPRQE